MPAPSRVTARRTTNPPHPLTHPATPQSGWLNRASPITGYGLAVNAQTDLLHKFYTYSVMATIHDLCMTLVEMMYTGAAVCMWWGGGGRRVFICKLFRACGYV